VAEHLYLHVPFCGHRCGYCDFVTVTGNTALHERYVEALATDVRRAAPAPRTIFIGGGTPSLLADALLERVCLAAVRDRIAAHEHGMGVRERRTGVSAFTGGATSAEEQYPAPSHAHEVGKHA